MDEFAQLSRENFEVFQRYGDAGLGPDPQHRAIAVYASPTAPTAYVEKDLKLEHLPKFFRNRSGSTDSNSRKSSTTTATAPRVASLKLVVIDSRLESWSNFFPSLWVTKDVFLNLVDAMAMDPSALWLLRSEYDGFHHFPCDDSLASKYDEGIGAGSGVDTYYVGTSNFALIWTFDRRNLHTQALWILRQGQSFSNSAPVAWFVNILRRHREHVYSPFLLAYVTALSVCCLFDGEISYRAHVVRLTERETGYSTHSSSIEERLGMESLTVYIKDVGEVLNHIANKERHFRLVDSILDFILENAILDPGIFSATEEESTRKLLAAIPFLRRRMHACQEYLKYLKERSERLSAVLFALLTHEDSATHAELADASRRIAEAAQRDSRSMKTVAIMTMAFLPATFFAALFALPSLDWRFFGSSGPTPSVVQPGFWVYWAFTLPATALVFLLWLLLDNKPLGKSRRKRKRGEGLEDDGASIASEERPRSTGG
ncbi:hypothetical protein F5Y04DRAFT_46888 [Hypomontagnella monticulosa]|nr:hypothetical protein F5Y04DRAFT_46888 [Hypomontagnella monticulosa]